MGHSTAEMRAYARKHASVFAEADSVIIRDLAARDLANSALDIAKMDEPELRAQLGVFFPELQRLNRKLRSLGIEP